MFASALTIVTVDKAKGKTLLQEQCATRHGPDGEGSALGMRIHAVDLRSEEVQSQSDADPSRVVSEGRKNMPPFKNALSKAEIDSPVAYIFGFRAAK